MSIPVACPGLPDNYPAPALRRLQLFLSDERFMEHAADASHVLSLPGGTLEKGLTQVLETSTIESQTLCLFQVRSGRRSPSASGGLSALFETGLV